jgi:arginyl-tRNA synthetase
LDNASFEKDNLNNLNTKNEIELIELINSFQNVMDKAINMVRPDIITNYLYKVAQTFHSYYAETKIIASSIKGEKVTLIKCIDKIIISGLKALDIKPMDRM